MGKKSRRNNKKEKEALIREAPGQTQAPGTPRTTLYKIVSGLFDADKFDEIRRLESKYGHLETFGNDPKEEFYIQYAFGAAHATAVGSSEERDQHWDFHSDRSIQYFERIAETMENSNIEEEFQGMVSWKPTLMKNLATLYAGRGREMEKAISAHRWFFANSNRDDVEELYI